MFHFGFELLVITGTKFISVSLEEPLVSMEKTQDCIKEKICFIPKELS